MQTVLADLSDSDLLSHVQQLLTSGAKLEVETLLALNIMHERKLYRPAGCESFHVYCVRVLRMSDDTAGRRSRVGKLLRLYPALVRELIETQQASVTALSKLTAVITDENAARLLNEVRGKTVAEVELMIVREAPKAAVQSGFRTVFAPSSSLNAERAPQAVVAATPRIDAASVLTSEAPPPLKKKAIEPRAVDHYAFSANMNETTKTQLKEAMDVGNFESYDALFAAAVELLRKELLKKKHALVDKPRAKTTADAERDARFARQSTVDEGATGFTERDPIPASVRRDVFIRDGGRCTFRGTHGRCTATRYLDYHHRIAAALGGKATVENITLHCHEHNIHQAELDFGVEHMRQFLQADQRA